jgi:hypothetical protein
MVEWPVHGVNDRRGLAACDRQCRVAAVNVEHVERPCALPLRRSPRRRTRRGRPRTRPARSSPNAAPRVAGGPLPWSSIPGCRRARRRGLLDERVGQHRDDELDPATARRGDGDPRGREHRDPKPSFPGALDVLSIGDARTAARHRHDVVAVVRSRAGSLSAMCRALAPLAAGQVDFSSQRPTDARRRVRRSTFPR